MLKGISTVLDELLERLHVELPVVEQLRNKASQRLVFGRTKPGRVAGLHLHVVDRVGNRFPSLGHLIEVSQTRGAFAERLEDLLAAGHDLLLCFAQPIQGCPHGLNILPVTIV